MKIHFTKRFVHKSRLGQSTYPPGASLHVPDDVAISAALEGATDTPAALDLAEASGAAAAADKALAKMTKAQLLEYIRAGNLPQGADDDPADATETIAALETALDAAEQRAIRAEKGEQSFRDLLKEAGISEDELRAGLEDDSK